jgi:uncharacterized protein (DUF1697 family)
MGTFVALLRGINLGPRNRIAMPALRESLTGAGYGHVRTYVQSGNVVLDTDQDSNGLVAGISTLLAEQFGLEVPVLARTSSELAAVIAGNPFRDEATSRPKALQVTFRSEAIEPEELSRLQASATATEKVAVNGREIYSWHPDGIARSKLALAITPRYAAATARNWTTVMTLLEMATTDVG